MRLTDAVLSFPILLLAIALVAIVGASLPLVVLLIAGVLWTGIARIVHSRMLTCAKSNSSWRPGPSASRRAGSWSTTSCRT